MTPSSVYVSQGRSFRLSRGWKVKRSAVHPCRCAFGERTSGTRWLKGRIVPKTVLNEVEVGEPPSPPLRWIARAFQTTAGDSRRTDWDTRGHTPICQRVVIHNIHTLRCHMYTVLGLMETWVASSNPARSIFFLCCCILSYVTDGTCDGPIPILHICSTRL